MNSQVQVLVLDDEAGSRESMAIALERAGFKVRSFDEVDAALAWIEAEGPPLVAVSDLKMPGKDGLDFLAALRERGWRLPVILVTAYASVESAVKAMQFGAVDYLRKPVELYELRTRVGQLVEQGRLHEEVRQLHEQLDQRYGFESILGNSEVMERLFERMRQVAPTRSSVLITGESGTGKELVAHALHRASPRHSERFLAINCGAIPSDILESELFGHERGAFTGAVSRKTGKFELAHRGTLFLDEISELYPELQVKLLRVLEERQIMRVGGSELLDVDFRLIAATNRDLEDEVEKGRFREDLYYRLKVVTLEIPPLRERRGDVPLLAEHYLAHFCAEHGRGEKHFSPAALEVLSRQAWPGNVRELRNTVESIVVFHEGDIIEREDLPRKLRQAAVAAAERSGGGGQTMSDIERQAILDALEQTDGHRGKAAELLDIGLRTLQRKLKEYREQGLWEG